ncbi:BREX system Lon protease-like protein BrxL [Calidithermus roseus]|uniref:BREX system Lon protease-like BrxL N-terminal domain-containing protein n=1 Tax=Calidithermus roseus TaxID=1644118 RepID=A0A399F0V4_9DEIN|nr:BREX system Lon protease-like protein BrxL [Calidithermus roseus]RIH89435.1 hypothetical protein Mrose_00335 [Calidithermus roseus]
MNDRLAKAFPGRVLAKHLTQRPVFHRVPRYVVEYLLAKFAPDGNANAVAKVQRLLQERYPGPEERERVKDQLLRKGRFVLIDELEVQVDLSTGRYSARIPSLGEIKAEVPFDLTERYPGVLYGLWGTIELSYDPARRQVRVADFLPFQVARIDLEEYRRAREAFTEAEWIDVLLMSLGINPRLLGTRLKLLYLARLAPLVEPGLHLMELGPRQTGKTFLLRNTSPEVFLISGGRATPATLFYHQLQRKPGLIPTYQVVIFDEVAHTRWDDPALLSTLKDFMESGRFSRGNRSFHAQASLVFLGNTDSAAVPQTKVLPDGLVGDTAFLDRLAGLLPGHEFPKLGPEWLNQDYGLVLDYLAEVLKRLRVQAFEPELTPYLPSGLTQRDVRAVFKLVAALLKLIFPGGDWPARVLGELVDLALELRERVYAELKYWNPAEFPSRQFGSRPVEGEPESLETNPNPSVRNATEPDAGTN